MRRLLADNALETLPTAVFAGLTALRRVELHNNSLAALPDGLFALLPALAVLLLDDNPRLAALPADLGAASPNLTAVCGRGSMPMAARWVPAVTCTALQLG